MKRRYFVAILVPKEIELALRDFYKQNYSGNLPVRQIHLTLIPPFYLKNGVSEEESVEMINKLRVTPFAINSLDLGVFEQKNKKILYVAVGPKWQCENLYSTVWRILSDKIAADVSPYDKGRVPNFMAHITLDYDFEGKIKNKLPPWLFVFDRVSLMGEIKGGGWRLVE